MKVYCEFCGAPAGDARSAKRLIDWVHQVSKDVIRCAEHRRTSKMSSIHRTHDPLTGEKRIA